MNPGDHPQQPAATPLDQDEILIYVGPTETGWDDTGGETDAFEQQARRKSLDAGLEKVKISDDELDRLRGQVSRIASRLDGDAGAGDARRGGFAVESVTLHIGVNASGHFFFVASAGMEAALDITWKRR